MVDAPESRENVKDMFADVTNVLEKDTIKHNDKSSINNMYNTILVTGDALPPKACHVRGEVVDLLGGQVLLPG